MASNPNLPMNSEFKSSDQLPATAALDRTPDTPSPRVNVRASYQGWSGFILESMSEPGAPRFVFDPSPDGELPVNELVIAITHGHPEHVQGARAHVRRRERAPVTVFASASVCRHLSRQSTVAGDRFVPVESGACVEAGGWRVRVFSWEHMTLLPPNLFLAAWYLLKLFSHPFRLARIGADSVVGPRHAPMLGFHVMPPGDEAALVYYGEGLHRHTTHEELRTAFGGAPIDALITAVEPEDTQQLPGLLGAYCIERIVAFEAHRIWREQFGMPQIDLPDLMQRLRDLGFATHTPAPGESLHLAP